MKSLARYVYLNIYLILAVLTIFQSSSLFCQEAAGDGSTDYVVFTGNANPALAKEVVDYMGLPLGNASVGKFNDGEIAIRINQNIRNKEVFIIQPTCSNSTQSVNDNLMELF